MRVHRARLFALALTGCALAACATIPKGRYGTQRIDWKGVEQMSPEALEACLATKKRDAVTLRLGLGSPSCGAPPFDEEPPYLTLWSWPWATWPEYDSAIFAVDKQRIVRWYEARGFYQAQVGGVRFSSDGKIIDPNQRCNADSCKLQIRIEVEEGLPSRVQKVTLVYDQPVPDDTRQALQKALTVHAHERFDESKYEADKAALLDRLKERGFARAKVEGEVKVDRDARSVEVRYLLHTGPACVFGSVRVEGYGELNAAVIADTADIPRGKPYRQSLVADAERAVYGLGAFSLVRIEPDGDDSSPTVNLVIHVRQGRLTTFRIGVGVMSGTLQSNVSDETFSVPEWDVHLKAAYRNQDFLGGMRRFSIEDRPRVIMLEEFPFIPHGGPRLGNTLSTNFEQPRFIEHRTSLFVSAAWDLGPDPFYGYFRHDLATKVGLRRRFFRHALTVELALEHDLYEIISAVHPDTVSSYRLPFVDEELRLDLRDNAQRPRRGLYLATSVHEALELQYGSWNYVRFLPEARAYQKLPWRFVLAERLAFGALFVLDANRKLDPTSQALGPQNYRFRGGGANSDRGFLPGTLGVGRTGGKRRWEGSLELRTPLSTDVELALFFDTGDVSQGNALRLDHLNAATGFGVRYFTPFAPIRVDFGWRIPGLESLSNDLPRAPTQVLPTAVHLTIGEPF